MLDLANICKLQSRIAPMRDPAMVQWRIVGGARGRLAQRTGTCAWYDAVSDTINVPEYLAIMVAEAMYAPTITHELCHAAQRKRMGLPLYLLAKTFRRSAIEAEAVAEERRAQTILKVGVL